jgi:hypothetical protein
MPGVKLSSERFFSETPQNVIRYGSHPEAIAYKQALDTLIDNIPDGPEKTDIVARLWSRDVNNHYAARLELYLYGLAIQATGSHPKIHPEVPNASTRPDFRFYHSVGDFYVEAVVALDSDAKRQQENRLREAVDATRRVRGDIYLCFSLVSDIPPNYPVSRIREFLELQITNLPKGASALDQSLTFLDTFNGSNVEIEFLVMATNIDGDPLVQAFGHAYASEVKVHERIQLSLATKARKYGRLDLPFLVAVWPKTEFLCSEKQVRQALFGIPQWRFDPKKMRFLGEYHKPDGIFTTIRAGHRIRQQLSAVAIYREDVVDTTVNQYMRIYHNPFATNPLPIEIFRGLPQFIPDGEKMKWIDTTEESLEP